MTTRPLQDLEGVAPFETRHIGPSPEEQAKTFVLPPGYRMELVLSEPQIDTPAVIEFDGNGRMYVAEFVTYMNDVDGTGQHEPISRISAFTTACISGVAPAPAPPAVGWYTYSSPMRTMSSVRAV